MIWDYNNSRVKTKTGVWDRAEIYSYNNIVNCVNYCVNNIDKDYNNNNGENNKIKSDNNIDNNNNRYNNKLEFIGGAKVLNIILIVIKMIVIV